jgi:hypothetical protein
MEVKGDERGVRDSLAGESGLIWGSVVKIRK